MTLITETIDNETPVESIEELLDDLESEIPEADRLFSAPSATEAQHLLRELEWGEHIVGTRMAAARGNNATYIYSLEEAATFFLDDRYASASLGTNGAFSWVDIDTFVDWVRDTVGDTAFAEVLEQKLSEKTVYNDKIEVLRYVLGLRISQFLPYLRDDKEEEEPTE